MLVEFAGDGEEFVEECVEVVLQLNIVGREPGDFKQVSEAERFHDSLGVVLVGPGDESVGEVGVFDKRCQAIAVKVTLATTAGCGVLRGSSATVPRRSSPVMTTSPVHIQRAVSRSQAAESS